MAESKITLYTRAIGFEAEKLFMIEDIESYLTSKEPSAPTTTIQYQKIELKKYIKIILDEVYSEPLKANNYVYCKIENLDNPNKYMYYWIKKLNWKSQNCIELDLILDTLNTFKIGTDYTFSPKTIIQRQHKDRASVFSGTLTTYSIGDFEIDNHCILLLKDSLTDVQLEYPNANPNNQMLVVINKNSDPDNYKYGQIEHIIPFNYIEIETQEGEEYPLLQVGIGGYEESFEYNTDDYYFGVYVRVSSSMIYSMYDEVLFDRYLEYNHLQLSKNIDKLNEDLNPPLYACHKDGEELSTKVLHDLTSVDMDWFLLYATNGSGDTRSVDCFLIPEKNISASYGGSDHRINPSMLSENQWYYVLLSNVHQAGTTGDYFNGTTYGVNNFFLANGQQIPSGDWNALFMQIKRVGNQIYGSVIVFDDEDLDNIWYVRRGYSFITDYMTCSYDGFNYGTGSVDYDLQSGSTSLGSISRDLCINGGRINTISATPLSTIDSLDRTRSEIVKLIKLPYIPDNFVSNNGVISINSNWVIASSVFGLTRVLKLDNKNLKFTRQLRTYDSGENKLLTPYDLTITDKSISIDFDDKFETDISLIDYKNDLEGKKFHSEFFLPKFFYDSFSYGYYLELSSKERRESLYAEYRDNNDGMVIYFHTTTTMNSRFGFEMYDWRKSVFAQEDINTWLLVSRNNEEVIYNDAYLNYIRSGYNYDVKNKETAHTRNWILAGGSILATAGALALTIASEGATAPLLVATISGAVATAGTLTNAITSDIQNERSIQQKLDTLKLQSASVSGSDDVDLMTRYCDNRLKLAYYTPNERVKTLLNNLFYYYGYKENINGIPNIKTRSWFNYLKCEPVFDFTSLNITDDIENELKNIMRTGFTIIHKNMDVSLRSGVNASKRWDVEQVRENWEVALLPYIPFNNTYIS